MGGDLKPGQKFPTPTPGFGDRVFYETLLRQRPDSAMAQEWCVYYEVLSLNEAERLHVIVTERKRATRLGSNTTSPSPQQKQRPVKKKKVVRVLKDDAYDDPDMIMSNGGGSDGIGVATLQHRHHLWYYN